MKHTTNWIAAILLLLLVVYFWLAFALVKLPVLLPAFVISKFTDESIIFNTRVHWKKYVYNMVVGDDQNTNTALGGDRDITISSRVGYNASKGNKIALNMELIINFLFKIFIGQYDHCRASIERDEKHNKDWGG